MKTILKTITAFVLIAVMAVMGSLRISAVDAEDLEGKIVILHTGDVHGALEGYASVAALKDEYEAKGAEVILTDAGGYSQGSPYVTTSQGQAAFELMKDAEYDFITLGEHEFEYGPAQITENLKSADGQFRILCCNVDGLDPDTVCQSAVYTAKSGMKIGFFGIIMPNAAMILSPKMTEGVTFLAGDELNSRIQSVISDLKNTQGADRIVALTHLGDDGISEPYTSTNLISEFSDIDIVIDGHSHKEMTFCGDHAIVQSAGANFQKIGVIVMDPQTGAVETCELLRTEELSKDRELEEKAEKIMEEIGSQNLRPIFGTEFNSLPDAPQTGGSFLWIWGILAVCSAGAGVCMISKSKRKKE